MVMFSAMHESSAQVPVVTLDALVRMVLLLVVAVSLPHLKWPHLPLLAAVALLLWVGLGRPGMGGAWRAVKKLRFFYLSLFLLYGWFYGGEPVWPALGDWSPAFDGLIEACLRVAALILFLAWFFVLIRSLSRNDLLCGIRQLIAPLGLLRVDTQRVALRMVLTLDALADVNAIVAEVRQRYPGGKAIRRWADVAADVLAATLREADAATERHAPAMPSQPRIPPWYQWSAPVLVAALIWGGGNV